MGQLDNRRRYRKNDSIVYTENDYLTFYNPGSTNAFLLFVIGSEVTTSIFTSVSYSLNNGNTWTTVNNQDGQQKSFTVSITPKNKVIVKGSGTSCSIEYNLSSSNTSKFCRFASSYGKLDVYGNVLSLLFGDNFVGKEVGNCGEKTFAGLFFNFSNTTTAPIIPGSTTKPYCFAHMFDGCSSLKTVPDINVSSSVTLGCCENMFANCTSLISTPKIIKTNKTTLATYCYANMFWGCTSLKNITFSLPDTTLSYNYCYSGMFANCTSLIEIPSGFLPATALAQGCYQGMFGNCTSLTTIPSNLLSSTGLAYHCYYGMFLGCTSLTEIPSGFLPATTLQTGCYYGMFKNCTSLTTPPALPALTMKDECYYQMFLGCTSLTATPNMNNIQYAASYCFYEMFSGCTNLTTAPTKLSPTTLYSYCYTRMFYNCRNLTTAPILPARTLQTGCYLEMFYNCSKLNYIKALFTTAPSTSYTKDWVKYVGSSGTYVKYTSATYTTRGYYAIPSGWTLQSASS